MNSFSLSPSSPQKTNKQTTTNKQTKTKTTNKERTKTKNNNNEQTNTKSNVQRNCRLQAKSSLTRVLTERNQVCLGAGRYLSKVRYVIGARLVLVRIFGSVQTA